jgi:hypothetical protein
VHDIIAKARGDRERRGHSFLARARELEQTAMARRVVAGG